MKHSYFSLLLFLSIQVTSFSQQTVLWEITKKDSEKKSYLLGTYHQLGGHYLDTFPLIKTKLIQSERAIFESLQLEKDRSYILDRPDNFAYKKHLPQKHHKALESIGKTWRFPLPKLTLGEIILLIEKEYYKHNCSNYLPNDSIKLQFDDYLQSIAIEHSIDLFGLETDSLQSLVINHYLNKIPKRKLKKQLVFWLNAIEFAKDNKSLCALPVAYKNLSLPYDFEKGCSEDDLFIKGRNDAWMPVLLAQLKDNNCFIAVGFNHLGSQCGLVESLKRSGFELTPVKLK